MEVKNNRMDLINELFFSKNRKLIDKEIIKVVKENTTNRDIINNILYHIKLNSNFTKPTLEHSKRLRSYLSLLFGNENDFKTSEILPLAITVELIHNATLIIDDIQDNDKYRCGELALWKKIGIPKSINTAFYLSNIAQAYYHKKKIENNYFDYSDLILKSLDQLFNGQQMDISGKIEKDIKEYETMAFGKTGALILLSISLSSMPYDFSNKKYNTLKDFSESFACYYQIRDDISDIVKNKKLDSGNIFNYIDIKSDQDRINFIYELMDKYEHKTYLSIKKMKLLGLLKTEKLNSIVNLLEIKK